jgi:hypothetical protein
MNTSYHTLPHNTTLSSTFYFSAFSVCWIEKHGKVWYTIKQTTILLKEHPLGVKISLLADFVGSQFVRLPPLPCFIVLKKKGK